MAKWTQEHENYLKNVILPIEDRLKEIMVGQRHVLRRVVQGLFAVGQRDFKARNGTLFRGAGHIVFEGPVGTGKTVLCKALSCLISGSSKRASGMPDHMASDITGCEIILLNGETKIIKGPVFCNVFPVDEINRYSPRAQVAFIECLAEGAVTISGITHDLPKPFICLATQNPTEQKGISKMQEALADRFMFKLVLKETTKEENIAIDQGTLAFNSELLKPITTCEKIEEVRNFFFDKEHIHISPVASACYDKLIRALNHPKDHGLFQEELSILAGEQLFQQPLPVNNRALLHISGAALMEAIWNRRVYVLPKDIYSVAADVLRARLLLSNASAHILLSSQNGKYQTETELVDYLINELLKNDYSTMKIAKRNFRSLELLAKSFINAYGAGLHHSLLQDSFGNIDTVREYMPGDRQLDSAASMRVGKVMSRVANPERQMTIFMVLDISRSGFYGQNNFKIEAGIATCLYLSFLSDIAHDKVGLIIFDDMVRNVCEPTIEVSDLLPVLNKIDRLVNGNKSTNLAEALKTVANFDLNNALIVIISDFYFSLSVQVMNLLRSISAGKNNSLTAMILTNEQEWQIGSLPFMASVLDAENDQAVKFCFGSKNSAISARADFLSWKRNLTMFLRQARCEPVFMEVGDDNFLKPLINYFLKIPSA